MISYIKGQLVQKNPTFIILETAGIGYHIHISLNTYTAIKDLAEVKINTYTQVKVDSNSLFGFYEIGEREIFELLISVSGISAITAQLILSSMTHNQVKNAILLESDQTFVKIKGIGLKTAKRIILDLKDKIFKLGSADISLTDESQLVKTNNILDETITALQSLGFIKNQVEKTVKEQWKLSNPDITLEQLLKSSLKALTS